MMDVKAVMDVMDVLRDVRVSSNSYAAAISSKNSRKGEGRDMKRKKIRMLKINTNRFRC